MRGRGAHWPRPHKAVIYGAQGAAAGMRYLSRRTKLPRWRLTHALRAYFQIRGNFYLHFPLSFPLFSFNGNWLVLRKRTLENFGLFYLGLQMENSGGFVLRKTGACTHNIFFMETHIWPKNSHIIFSYIILILFVWLFVCCFMLVCISITKVIYLLFCYFNFVIIHLRLYY